MTMEYIVESDRRGSKGQMYRAGVRAVLPLLVGVAPFSFITGVAAVAAGIPEALSASMSVVIYAGASQMATASLVESNAALWVVVLSAWTINLRFVMYSAALAPSLKHLPLRWKAPLAYMLSDHAFAATINRLNEGVRHPEYYFLGAVSSIWSLWLVCATAGVYLGAMIPASWGLEFAAPLSLMGLALMGIRGPATAAAGVTGAVVSLLASGVPYNLGIMVAAAAGIGAGLAVQRRWV